MAVGVYTHEVTRERKLTHLLVSATLPSSYWYMQNFDIVGMEPYLDWFNIMSKWSVLLSVSSVLSLQATYNFHGLSHLNQANDLPSLRYSWNLGWEQPVS